MRDQHSWSSVRIRGTASVARLVRRSASLAASIFLVVCLGAPNLGAEQAEDKPAGGDVATTAETDEKSDGQDAKKNEKKGPPVIAVPIIITEPAVGYGLGAAVGYFHKKRSTWRLAEVRPPRS